MLSGSVGKLGKFRLTDEVRHPSLCVGSELSGPVFSCRVDGVLPRGVRVLILEVMIPRGARALYGLLGGRFVPSDEGGKLLVRTAIESDITPVYGDALLAPIEPVKVGLPAEYALAAVHGVERAVSKGVDLRPGSLEFCYAGHGEASSNAPIFDQLGYSLTNLLCLSIESISAETVDELLTRTTKSD